MNRLTKDIFQYILGGLVVIGFYALLYILMKTELPQSNRDLLSLTIGALIGSFTSIVGYFYGSSKGSAEKDVIIRHKTKTE